MRRLTIGVLASAIGVVAASSIPARAQAPVRPSASATPAKPYTTPKTPWGDPDISGTWSSDDLRTVPVQRPVELGNQAQLSDEEYAKRLAANDQARSRELNRVGAFRNDVGTRTFRQTSLVIEPADGRLPITPEAQKEVERRQQQRSNPPNTWTDRSLYDRCITRGVFGSVLPVIYGNGNFIFQSPGVVSITYEMVHDTRIISLDGRPHVGAGIRQYMGDARGHFEGDTLVVETTNFLPETAPQGATEHVVMTERFTAVSPTVVEWRVTFEDSNTWTRPWTYVMPLTKVDSSQQVFEYACHEGNHAMRNILSAARAAEK